MATSKPTTLSRRAALAGGASAIALAGTATVAIAAAAHENPDAKLLRLCDAFWRMESEVKEIARQEGVVFRAVDLTHPQPEGDHVELFLVKRDPEYCRAHKARQKALRRAGLNDLEDQIGEIADRQWDVVHGIRDMPAATVNGMLAKARVGRRAGGAEMDDIDHADPEAQMFVSITADLERLAGVS